MSPTEKNQLDNAARAQQMIINTRLTALQAAQTLMSTNNYSYMEIRQNVGGPSETTRHGGAVDHITLLAIAGDIEKYILGDMEEEAKKAIENAHKPKPTIVPAAEIPKGLRP